MGSNDGHYLDAFPRLFDDSEIRITSTFRFWPGCRIPFYKTSFAYVEIVQNTTIEERVTILEGQMVDVQEDVGVLEVGQVVQDEQLLALEQQTQGFFPSLFILILFKENKLVQESFEN